MTTSTKAIETVPDKPHARSAYVDRLRALYATGDLDAVLVREIVWVPDLLLAEIFPRLFPMMN
jgi:hypothetical protein